ncbi:MAG TPA: DNA repair protein RadA [Clostridia bacterium]|nr:DNA repair protein RadA [Clostridia bacterium]
MPKVKTQFTCQECGFNSPRWLGRCPGCGSWNRFVEESTTRVKTKGRKRLARLKPISEISPDQEKRITCGLPELDRVLGGGIVPGSLILLGGDPGIGKSTLLLQAAHNIAETTGSALYISGEESERQVRLRADRINAVSEELYLVCTNELSVAEAYIRELKSSVVVVDSIQAIFTEDITSAPGSVGQVRECASRLMRLAKSTGVTILLVGHVTKEGAIAGPRVLEHMVDAVLYLEGERHQNFRLLRGVKNRFGSTNELGVFEMHGNGLMEVKNPSTLFLAGYGQDEAIGSVVSSCLEGTRPLLVEIQALVCPTSYGVPRRMTAGVDYNRVALIMAVLDKRVGLHISGNDAYVNAVGGVKLTEPGIDLAIALSLASSYREKPVRGRTAAIGEIGLTAEIRPVTAIDKRCSEAGRLGFTRCIVPAANFEGTKSGAKRDSKDSIEIIKVKTLAEAIELGLYE